MEFKKYMSIENHYREKYIDKAIQRYPELMNERYIVTEKIHGANFQIVISKSEVRYGKRTSFLDINERFFNFQQAINSREIKNFIDNVRSCIGDDTFIFYGELFGQGVQKEVYYQGTQKIRFFDVYNMTTDYLFPPEEAIRKFFIENQELFVPILDITDNLQKALDFDVEINSTIAGINDNLIEGVVIRPYDRNYFTMPGKPFVIKKKGSKFKEKNKKRKVEVKEISQELTEMLERVLQYHNENRLQNVFSKNGLPEDSSEVGKYIKLYLNDLYEDVKKDIPDFFELSKKDRSYINKRITSDLAKMILKDV